MRQVRRPSVRRGSRRSFLANVEPSSINIGNISRNIRGKLREIKKYRVPRFPNSVVYGSYDNNEDESYSSYNGSKAHSSYKHNNPSYGNQQENNKVDEKGHSYITKGNIEERDNTQGNVVKNNKTENGEIVNNKNIEYQANTVYTKDYARDDEPSYSNSVKKIIHLQPDEQYILSTSGKKRETNTISKYYSPEEQSFYVKDANAQQQLQQNYHSKVPAQQASLQPTYYTPVAEANKEYVQQVPNGYIANSETYRVPLSHTQAQPLQQQAIQEELYTNPKQPMLQYVPQPAGCCTKQCTPQQQYVGHNNMACEVCDTNNIKHEECNCINTQGYKVRRDCICRKCGVCNIYIY